MTNHAKSSRYERFLHFGPFRLDAVERRLFRGNERVALPGKAFDLLCLLVESNGHLKSREELIEAVWPTTIVVENNLNWNVRRVRKALGDKNGSIYIETVRGHGYRFIAPVEVERVPIPRPEEDTGEAVSAEIATETVPPTGDADGASESEDVGATSVAINPPYAEIAAEAAPTGSGSAYRGIAAEAAPTGSAYRGIAAEAAPTGGSRSGRTPGRRRISLITLAGAAIVVIVGILIWQFVPFGSGANGKSATPVIAVLPFENLSADAANAYFAAGIQDTILSKLAGIGGLRVISHTSTEHYPSHPQNLKRVARQLGATAIVEGGVQKSGDQVLINIQLIDAKTNEPIWAYDYSRKLNDIFAVETHVATRIAEALQANLSPAETAQLNNRPTHDLQAYLRYLKGNYYLQKVATTGSTMDPAGAAAKAAALFHQAVARDPGFTLAWSHLSLIKSFSYQLGIVRTPQTASDAEHAAKQALALKPESPEALLATGYVDLYIHHSYAAALARLKQVHQSRPSNVNIIGAIAFMQRRQGKWQESLANLRQAIRLDPRFPGWRSQIGANLAMLRRYKHAIHQYDYALALNPTNHVAAALKAATLLLAGKPLEKVRGVLADIPIGNSQHGFAQALRFKVSWLHRHPKAALAALEDAPDWVESSDASGQEPTSLLRAQAWAMQGDETQSHKNYEKARSMLHNALEKHPKNASLWAFLGLAEAGLGHKQQAIQAGRKAMTLVPVVKDAIDGSSYLVTLAKIYAQVGEPGQAIELLRVSMTIPAGLFVSAASLKRDPIWDPLRKDPEFQALLKKYGSKQTPIRTPSSATTD